MGYKSASKHTAVYLLYDYIIYSVRITFIFFTKKTFFIQFNEYQIH